MQPRRIRIENFRSYNLTEWKNIGDKLITVGENNAGKSNLLRAFDMFFTFNSHTGHERSDFHKDNVGDPIYIYIEFVDLSEEEREIFEENIFDGKLTVRAKLPFDEDLNTANTKHYYGQKEVLKHDELRGISSLDPEEAVEVYHKYEDLLSPYQNDDRWTGENRASVARVIDAYRNSGTAETEKKWEKLSKKDLDAYTPEFSYFPASRSLDDATRTTNKTSLLSQLLRSSIDEIPDSKTDDINSSLEEVKSRINGDDKFLQISQLEKQLSEKLSSQIPDLDGISIKADIPDLDEILTRNVQVHVNDANQSTIGDTGSGSQMSFVLACLWELTERDAENTIFALEEPENDLHPHAQRQLYRTLNQLTKQGHTVLLSTHSPELVTLDDIDDVIRVEKRDGVSRLYGIHDDTFSDEEKRKLSTLMTVDKNEIFFSRGILLCEGASERLTIPLLNEILSRYEEDVDLLDSHGASLVATGGKSNMPLFAKLSNEFNIPCVAILDDDRVENGDHQKHDELVLELKELTREFIHLEEDLEFALFQSLSVEEFCASMDIVCPFDHTPDDLRTEMQETGWSKEEVFEKWFSEHDPSKPQFGRAAVSQINENRVPDQIAEAIRNATKVTER